MTHIAVTGHGDDGGDYDGGGGDDVQGGGGGGGRERTPRHSLWTAPLTHTTAIGPSIYYSSDRQCVQVVPYMHVWWRWMPAPAQCLQKTTTVL